jgi:hypothetical protein
MVIEHHRRAIEVPVYYDGPGCDFSGSTRKGYEIILMCLNWIILKEIQMKRRELLFSSNRILQQLQENGIGDVQYTFFAGCFFSASKMFDYFRNGKAKGTSWK